ncbi:hypothetical protein MMC19_002042 [Ptychographa xylographoides]|nr:hypothetical protein [Ptychographa xylographoides]
MAASPKVLFVMADYGHDPTETAVPYLAFKDAGFDISFVTENGKSPECDARMLTGWTQKLLGATQEACSAYHQMKSDTAIQTPLSWTAPTFSLDAYNLLFFPGGHEKRVRQVIDSPIIHKSLRKYFPKTRKASDRAVAAICHGVLALSETTFPGGQSLLHDVTTTTLPSAFEGTAYWSTRLFLGDYYKTYGAGSESVETSVKKRLDDPSAQFRSSLGMAPFVVEDEKYNYISGRFPADADLLAQKAIALVKGNAKA